ncbi:MAG TPA: NUDIX hydrolase [Mycobacteriales bacterium]|nr:NUDIX hydrolase [Mycobacteriales bacterium]
MTHDFRVLSSTERFSGRVVSLVSDEIALPGGTGVRDYVVHPGAVAVVALDDRDRVVLVRQYRHPVRSELVELPAGLLDAPGEPALETARRELWEEADLRASEWHVLADLLTSPGGSDEAIRVYLARGLTAVPAAERHTREAEEAVMTVSRVDLDAAVGMVFDGRVQNATCAAGVLAAARARENGFAGLRPADAPWGARPDR